MERRDFQDFETVFALFTISHCADMMFDEIAECDLPEMLRDDYRAVRESIHSLMESLEQDLDDKKDTFMSACED